MNRNEFLNKLEEELSESFNKSEINKQLDYYSKYIDDEVKKGRTEPEVLTELGDPRLIVKTLKTVNGKDGIVPEENNNDSNENENGDSEERHNGTRRTTYYQPIMGNNGTIGCIIFILIFFIIGASLLKLMGVILTGTVGLFFASPFFFILLVFIIYNLFKNRQ